MHIYIKQDSAVKAVFSPITTRGVLGDDKMGRTSTFTDKISKCVIDLMSNVVVALAANASTNLCDKDGR